MIKKGVYAAGLSIINDDYTLNVESTISHAASLINKGLHGVFFLVLQARVSLYQSLKKKVLFQKLQIIN